METENIEIQDMVPEYEEDSQREEQFKDLLDEYEYERPKRGKVLDGEILFIDEESILVDVGAKRDAVIPGKDLKDLDEEFISTMKPGDKVPVYVTETPVGDENLVVSLSEGIKYLDWEKAESHLEESKSVELEVIGKNKGGLLVRFGNLEGFIPGSLVPALRRTGNRKSTEKIKQEMIGSKILVKVIEVDRERRRLIFSAKAAQKEQRKQRQEELEPGQIIDGWVTNVVEFGVFVDLGGVDGLLHKSEIAWERVNKPKKWFNVGDEVTVKVLSVDEERERIGLSRKALLTNPWQLVADNYEPGDLLVGEVTNVVDFGAFVKIPEGVQGLVHVSELGYSAPGSPEDVVKPGEKILVRVKSISPDKEQIDLSMRRVPVEDQITWMLNEWEEEQSTDEEEEEEEAEGIEPVAAAEEAAEESEEAAEAEPEAPEVEAAETEGVVAEEEALAEEETVAGEAEAAEEDEEATPVEAKEDVDETGNDVEDASESEPKSEVEEASEAEAEAFSGEEEDEDEVEENENDPEPVAA